MNRLNKKKFDYTWVIIGCCFLMVFTALGFCSSPQQLFLKATTEALDIKRSAYSLHTTFRYATLAGVNLVFSVLINKIKPKKLIIFGFACLVLSALMYAWANNVVLIYLGGTLLGLGLCFTANTMASYVITSRCTKNTGTILGLVMSANGLGGAVAMKILDPIIESSTFAYRQAYYLVAIILASVGILIAILFKDQDDAAPMKKKTKKARGQGWDGIPFAEGKKKIYFFPIAVCMLFTGFMISGINGVSVAHAKGTGLDPTFVTDVWAIHSLVLMGSKFLVGFLYDKAGLRTVLLVCQITALLALSALALVAATITGSVMWIIYAVGSTLALPLETVCVSLITGDLFGNKDFGKYLGIMSAMNSLGLAIGSPVMNLFYDIKGSYVLAIWIAVGVIAAVSIIFQLLITVARKDRKKIMEQNQLTELTD